MRIEEEVEPTIGLPRHRHFVVFFNVPVQAPTRDQPFYGHSEKPPHLVAFYDTLGILRTYSHLKTRVPTGKCGPRGFKMRIGSCTLIQKMAIFYICIIANIISNSF